jgi:hypothetical protein
VFDKRLRSLVFSELEKIEVAVRTKLSLVYSLSTDDAMWYEDESMYADSAHAQYILDDIKSDVYTSYNAKNNKRSLSNEVTRNISPFNNFRTYGLCRKKITNAKKNKYKIRTKSNESKTKKLNYIRNEKLKNYKLSKIEKESQEDKECTFFPKVNHKYNYRSIDRPQTVANNKKDNRANIYKRNQLWKESVTKKNNYYNNVNKKGDEKYSFVPNINKKQNFITMFKDNEYSNYWLNHNKFYIHRRLKFINHNKNNISSLNSCYLTLKDNNDLLNKKYGENRINYLNPNVQIAPKKVNINYIKKLLREELQNIEIDDNNEN